MRKIFEYKSGLKYDKLTPEALIDLCLTLERFSEKNIGHRVDENCGLFKALKRELQLLQQLVNDNDI